MSDGVAPPVPPATGLSDSAATAVETLESVQKRYTAERQKRLRQDGLKQYIDLSQASDRFRHFADDPWVDHDNLNQQEPPLVDGSSVKVLILGAGYTGELFAVRMLEAGIKPEDIRLADTAGGFGGTWYWSRFPGLMCDIESYCYLPLLEETGHVPKHKYSYGPELRGQAERIADKYGLRSITSLRTQVKSLEWTDEHKAWEVALEEHRGSEGTRSIQIRARFVILASGYLNFPQISRFEGLEDFKGHMFHTSRWDYKYTGGSPEEPKLVNLKDENVGIIGTGATAVQAIPELAKSAKHLYVFQRTPASVDVRDNKQTIKEEWENEIATGHGWQAKRRWNFLDTLSGTSPKPAVDMVNDGWTRSPSIGALYGAPGKGALTPDDLPTHVAGLHALDLVRLQRVRARVDEIVEDNTTAEKLKAWYPSWCKRPCFHDDYLPAFNRDNVTLVDTDGQGIERLTKHGVVANGQEYTVDCLVLATGFRSPFSGGGAPASKSNVKVKGRSGVTFDEKWAKGIATLHGFCSNGFPNLLWPGLSQAALDGNISHCAQHQADHVSYIVSEALKRSNGGAVTVEPSIEAEEQWAQQTAMQAMGFAQMAGCTPSYYNNEGEADREVPPDVQLVKARAAGWANGFRDYIGIVEKWRADGGMEGLQVVA